MGNTSLCAVYDFELFPYALGDVLTWNVQTAIRCEELGRKSVDIFICLDERHPAFFYQRDFVTSDNCWLFFNELFGAFKTHPKLGGLFVYRRREEMIDRLRTLSKEDTANSEVLSDYERALACGKYRLDVRSEFFTKSIHSHKRINTFAAEHGRIPLLRAALGYEAEIARLIEERFAGKRIVAVHMRLRRVDAGYGAADTYARDSDFLEWSEFLREANRRHPSVQFVVLGRIQEKPLEILRRPNVISLRTLGLGLGHELTLMLQSDLFMGTSSGFAAMANFSAIPYFITYMNRNSCIAYGIEPGAERLPFATERQILVYEPETSHMLLRLLKRGLDGASLRSAPCDESDSTVISGSSQMETYAGTSDRYSR